MSETPKKAIRNSEGKIVLEEAAAGGIGELVRAVSLNDKRENAYSVTVGVDGFIVYIFEHKRARVQEFRRRLQELAATGEELQKRPYPVLPANATQAETAQYEAEVETETQKRGAEAEALQADLDAIYGEVNSCIRGWNFPDENGDSKPRPVNYAAEVEVENIGPALVPLLFQRILEKHTLGSDERQRPQRS